MSAKKTNTKKPAAKAPEVKPIKSTIPEGNANENKALEDDQEKTKIPDEKPAKTTDKKSKPAKSERIEINGDIVVLKNGNDFHYCHRHEMEAAKKHYGDKYAWDVIAEVGSDVEAENFIKQQNA